MTMLARPGSASRRLAFGTMLLGGLTGILLAQLLAAVNSAAAVGLAFVTATALLIGWSNGASP